MLVRVRSPKIKNILFNPVLAYLYQGQHETEVRLEDLLPDRCAKGVPRSAQTRAKMPSFINLIGIFVPAQSQAVILLLYNTRAQQTR
jgi:hypothetical protein